MCDTDLKPVLDRLDAVLDRLDAQQKRTEARAEALEIANELLAEDRRQISRVIVLLRRVIEGSEHVAADLAASIARADGGSLDTPGASADAALRSAATDD